MRRGLAGLLFFVAAVCLALAAGGWWLQRVAFDTRPSGDLADVVLRRRAIRAQIARVGADATAATLGVPPLELRTHGRDVACRRTIPRSGPPSRPCIADAHARLIGGATSRCRSPGRSWSSSPATSASPLLPPVILPVEEVAALNTIRIGLDWAVPIAAIVGGVALLLGLVAHPRRADAVFGIGMFCIVAAGAALVLGYLVPVFIVPELSDNIWLALVPAIAKNALPVILGSVVVLVAAALGLMAASAAIDRRRRSWDKPIAVHPHADQRRWS